MIARLAISSIVWVTCSPALFFYGVLVLGGAHSYGTGGELSAPSAGPQLIAYSFASGAVAWLILAAMNVAWLGQRRLGAPIPALGSLCALFGLAPFLIADLWYALLALPGVVFAIYLVRWHISCERGRHG